MNESVSPTLSGRVLALMRNDILELRLEPGSKLLFEALREKYDVGLSPLRESLSRLVVEGLVVGEDRRGFRVAPMTEEDYIDLTTLWFRPAARRGSCSCGGSCSITSCAISGSPRAISRAAPSTTPSTRRCS